LTWWVSPGWHLFSLTTGRPRRTWIPNNQQGVEKRDARRPDKAQFGQKAQVYGDIAMMRTRRFIWVLCIVAGIAGWRGVGVCGSVATPQKGSLMPTMTLNAPASQKECDYLGIAPQQPFQLADVNAELIMLEIIGVYCPQCHKQRPYINRLYHRIQKDAAMAKKVKFVGIAVGATPMEVAYLVKESRIPYPIVADGTFDAHKRLGEPRTPFNIVATKEGKVLWTHLGIIEDMNAFRSTLKSLAGL
jgi:hypothetical protein